MDEQPKIRDSRVFVNPKDFTEADLPVVVLADDLRGLISWAIRAHTSGNYNHAFIMHKPGMIVSQDFVGFRERKIDVYMTDGCILKFWRLKDMTEEERRVVLDAVEYRLALPWYKKQYDWLGIVGQFTRIKFIQNPFKFFCSEQVRRDFFGKIMRALTKVPDYPSPVDLNKVFVKNTDIMECLGYWWAD